MCKCISGIAVLSNGKVKIYTSVKSDSHSDIREEYGIRDDNSPIADRQTPIELVPITGLTELKDMEFRFDDCRPSWWTDNMTDDAKRQLFRALKNRWDGNKFEFIDYLYLSSLTSIPEGVTLSAGGYLDLSSLTSIPEGVTLSAGGYLDLGSLTSIPEGVTAKYDNLILKETL